MVNERIPVRSQTLGDKYDVRDENKDYKYQLIYKDKLISE